MGQAGGSPLKHPGPDARALARNRGREAWSGPLFFWLVSRAWTFLAGFLSLWLLSRGKGFLSWPELVQAWRRWDADYYLKIAASGYTGPGVDPRVVAFFPLYPALTKAVWLLVGDPVISGLLVSLASSLLAFRLLWALAEESGYSGFGAALSLAAFPTAVFLAAPYPEALFLAGAAGAFLYARRGRWLAAGLLAAVATASKPQGLFLLPGLLVEYLLVSRPRRLLSHHLLWIPLASLPPAAFSFYQKAVLGNPLAWLQAQQRWWWRQYVGPWRSFLATLAGARFQGFPTNWIMALRMELAAAALGLVVLALLATRREWGFLAYAGTALGAFMVSTYYFSIPRLLLVLFPVHLELGRAARGLKGAVALALLGTALGTVGTVVYLQGMWFF